MKKEKIILFTHADHYQQSELNLSYIDLERSLKNSIILFGKVTVSTSSILKSDLTYNLIKEAKELLLNGLILPDLREGYDSFGHYYDKNIHSFKNRVETKSRVNFLDNNTHVAINFSAHQTSKTFTDNLISILFYLKLSGDIKISWSDLENLSSLLKKTQITNREMVLNQLKKVSHNKKLIFNCIQSIYHILGAIVTNSHPIWPNSYSEAYKRVGVAQQETVTKIAKNKEAILFANKYHIFTEGESLKYFEQKKISSENLRELHNFSFATNEALDALSWNDVINISKKRVSVITRNKIFNNKNDDEYFNLTQLIKQEHKTTGLISKTTKGISLASIITGSASLVDNPVIASAGFALSLSGLLLTLTDSFINNEVRKRLDSFTMLGELVQTTAKRNRLESRLEKINRL